MRSHRYRVRFSTLNKLGGISEVEHYLGSKERAFSLAKAFLDARDPKKDKRVGSFRITGESQVWEGGRIVADVRIEHITSQGYQLIGEQS